MSQTIADKIHRALLLMSQIELTHSLWHTPRLKVRKTTLQTKLKLYGGAAQILQRSRNHLKISGSRRVRRNTLHAEDAQILDIIVKKKKVAMAIRSPGFLRPWWMRAIAVLYHYIRVYIISARFLKYFPDTTPPTFYTVILSSTRRCRRTKLKLR